MPSIRGTSATPRAAPTALLVGGALLVGCPAAPEAPRYLGAGNEAPRRGGTFVFHHEDNVRGLDPFVAFDELSNMAIRLVFDGLLDYDEHARLVPNLAVAMPTVSSDGRTFHFELRRGVRFHHGRELVAEDVRWSMERMLSREVGSPGYTFFANLRGVDAYREGRAPHVEGIRVVGRYAIEFTLREPDQTFLNAMGMAFAYPVPREHYEAHASEISERPVGTGPFRLVRWDRGVELVFERNVHYWRPGRPYPDQMVFLENLARHAAVMRFRNGDLDAVHRFTPADYLFFKRSPAWRPYQVETPKVNLWGLVMNCELPPFDNVHVRRAVAFAVDRERWKRARANRLRPTNQPIPPGIAGYREDLPDRQRYDLAAAREELALAGHPNGLPEEVTLWIGAGDTGRFYGELAQSDLARIGVRVRLKQVAFPTYLQETGKPRTVQMSLGGWSQDFPDAADFLDILFHSRAIHERDSENKAFYRNPELDALLDRARIERDPARRREMYERASSLVAREAPWAFLWNDVQLSAWQPYVRGYVPNPVWDNDYRNVWLDLPRRRVATWARAGLGALGLARLPLGRP